MYCNWISNVIQHRCYCMMPCHMFIAVVDLRGFPSQHPRAAETGHPGLRTISQSPAQPSCHSVPQYILIVSGFWKIVEIPTRHDPIMHCRCGFPHSIFRPTNHKKVSQLDASNWLTFLWLVGQHLSPNYSLSTTRLRLFTSLGLHNNSSQKPTPWESYTTET